MASFTGETLKAGGLSPALARACLDLDEGRAAEVEAAAVSAATAIPSGLPVLTAWCTSSWWAMSTATFQSPGPRL